MQEIKVEKPFMVSLLTETAKVPTRSTDLAVGYDIYADCDATIKAGERGLISTGLVFKMNPNFYLTVNGRSGLASKGIDAHLGIIDPDYTGELKVLLKNFSKEDFKVEKGMRVAQLVIHIRYSADFEVIPYEKPNKERGGFGSTGI